MPEAPFILVVENEYDLAALLLAYLGLHGYRVATVNSRGLGAEVILALHPDLVIADVALQQRDGPGLTALARSLDVPILLTSGDSRTIRRLEESRLPFLAKPYQLSALKREVERSLFSLSEIRDAMPPIHRM